MDEDLKLRRPAVVDPGVAALRRRFAAIFEDVLALVPDVDQVLTASKPDIRKTAVATSVRTLPKKVRSANFMDSPAGSTRQFRMRALHRRL